VKNTGSTPAIAENHLKSKKKSWWVMCGWFPHWWVICVVGLVIPASYRTGTDGDIRAFYKHMLVFGLIRAKQGGAGLFLTDIASGAGQNGCSVILGAA